MLFALPLLSQALVLAPLRGPAPLLGARHVATVHMQEKTPGGWGIVPQYRATPSPAGGATAAASPLDTTDKFDEIASAAAAMGSAAEAEGREPGTCDPYDPKSAEFCSPEVPAEASSLRRTLKLGVLFFLCAFGHWNRNVTLALPLLT